MKSRTLLLAATLGALPIGAEAQTPARVRGTLTAVSDTLIHVMPNGGGDDSIALPAGAKITSVVPAKLTDIKAGSFVGTAAKTQDDGTMVAVEVHIFPESMRGSGEGHRAFDLGPKSTMTNGTIGNEVVGSTGQTLTVRYKGGEKSVLVPPETPIVTFEAADRSALAPGAHVIVFAQKKDDGSLSAANVLVGKDGLVPPM